MRIAVANWTGRLAGGAEAVMFESLGAFAFAGDEVALWSEVHGPHDRPGRLVEGPAWCVEETGLDRAFSVLRRWSPDVICVHGMLNPRVEDQLLTVAPGVLFAHGYCGTCISGNKTLTFPPVRPCPPLDPALRRSLQAEFAPDVCALSELRGWDLTHWVSE